MSGKVYVNFRCYDTKREWTEEFDSREDAWRRMALCDKNRDSGDNEIWCGFPYMKDPIDQEHVLVA